MTRCCLGKSAGKPARPRAARRASPPVLGLLALRAQGWQGSPAGAPHPPPSSGRLRHNPRGLQPSSGEPGRWRATTPGQGHQGRRPGHSSRKEHGRWAPIPHLMTTRLPFTSTLSRVSLLERDMFALDQIRSSPLGRSALNRTSAPQRLPAPPAPSASRPCQPAIGPHCRRGSLLVVLPACRCTARPHGSAGCGGRPVTSRTQPPGPAWAGLAVCGGAAPQRRCCAVWGHARLVQGAFLNRGPGRQPSSQPRI